MLLFFWVWMKGEGGGGVATVIVGLSFAVKIPSGKIRIYPCVVTALQEPQ